MRFSVPLLAMFALRAQAPLPPDLDALTKIRTRMNFNLAHQPNYTCVETIERSSRLKSTHKMKILDTLRLEVALVEGREMFAWPGSKKFDDVDVTKMITSGAIGSGDFGTHARALFSTRVATFHYLGIQDLQGRKAIKFDYDVPRMLSGYRIHVSAASAIVGYHGSFYADPSTYDVQRIEIVADQIPPDLLLQSAEDKIDYATMHIGDGDFLLPSQSELTMFDLNGGANQNHVRFTSCRQFSGESTLTFDEAPAALEKAPAALREFDLPAGLELYLSLTGDIDLETVATGDPVRVRLDQDVKLKGKVLIPKGATAVGRITRFERNEGFSMVGMEFPQLDAPGLVARMKGTLARTMGISPVRGRYQLRSRTPAMPGEGIFPVNDTQRHLLRGCIIVWRT